MSMTTVGSVGARAAGHRAEEGELRLFLAGEDAGVEAVVLAHARGEGGAVGGVAHGRGEHGEVGLAVVGVDRGAVVGERVQHASDGLLREGATGVDAVAQTGDLGAPEEFLDGAGRRIDVGDEQAGGVGSDVDDGDAHGGRGC